MDKGYFLEYYELERNHWWFRARSNIIKSHISSLTRNKKQLNILNVGAATGATSVMLSDFGKVTSVEYDADCCLFLKEHLNINAVNCSVTGLPFEDQSFDLVCAFDVIEHVSEDQKAADELKRVCRNGGWIVCTVPAYMFLWSHHDVVNHHIRRYTKGSFKGLFPGCSKTFISYFNTFLFPFIALLRLTDRIFHIKSLRRDAGSDFSIIKNSQVNSFFFKIMNAENFLLKKRISMPFGVSLLFSCEKQA